MDKGRKHPLIWVSGPAGSGKTTMVSSYISSRSLKSLWYQVDKGDKDLATFFHYMGLAVKKATPRKRKPMPLLTPEYLMGIPAFTRRFFDEIFSRLKAPSVVVFDNVQEASGSGTFMDMISEGIAHVPEGISVVLISRETTPAGLARRSVSGDIFEIGWDELSLTEAEARGLAKRVGYRGGGINDINKRASGWAAGVVLLMEGVKGEIPEDFVPDRVFDYFASEVLRATDPSMKEFLLGTAFLPGMTEAMADEVRCGQDSGRMLMRLIRMNYFTQRSLGRESVYNYHPLFRGFLMDRARKEFSPDKLSSIRQRSAGVLSGAGRYEDAAGLFMKESDWKGLSGLVIINAQELLSQGRNNVLLGWIGRMPPDLSSKDPWLLYWKGIAGLPFDPVNSKGILELAFDLFRNAGITEGIYLSWAGVMDAILYAFEDFKQLDSWIVLLEELESEYGSLPDGMIEALVVSAMFCALSMRQPLHPRIAMWHDRALMIARSSPDLNMKARIFFYSMVWIQSFGDKVDMDESFNEIRGLLRIKDIPPLAHITIKLSEVIYAMVVADSDRCKRAGKEGLEIAESSGMHMFNFMLLGQTAWARLNDGELDMASDFLSRMKAENIALRPWDENFHLFIKALNAYSLENIMEAKEHAEKALEQGNRIGCTDQNFIMISLLNARIASELGEHDNAMTFAGDALRRAEAFGSENHLGFFCKLLQSRLLMLSGDGDKGLDVLRNALALGATRRFMNILWPVEDLSHLCALAIEHGIEVDYVKWLIMERGLKPPLFVHHKGWPYKVRIRAMGIFMIERDERVLSFKGKVPRRPLAILKCLIASGGINVPVEHLTDSVWPDADGDSALRSFTAALHRLRKLLGDDRLLRLSEGRLSLERGLCFVDSIAFKELRVQAEGAVGEERKRIMQRALGLYRGDFLETEQHEPWSIPAREKLRNEALNLLAELASMYEDEGNWAEASSMHEKGISLNPLVEECHRGYMRCLLSMGDKSGAAGAYVRCRDALEAGLGIRPSADTRRLYEQARVSQ
jgi:DNA-binding SARP family transcriptional activator